MVRRPKTLVACATATARPASARRDPSAAMANATVGPRWMHAEFAVGIQLLAPKTFVQTELLIAMASAMEHLLPMSAVSATGMAQRVAQATLIAKTCVEDQQLWTSATFVVVTVHRARQTFVQRVRSIVQANATVLTRLTHVIFVTELVRVVSVAGAMTARSIAKVCATVQLHWIHAMSAMGTEPLAQKASAQMALLAAMECVTAVLFTTNARCVTATERRAAQATLTATASVVVVLLLTTAECAMALVHPVLSHTVPTVSLIVPESAMAPAHMTTVGSATVTVAVAAFAKVVLWIVKAPAMAALSGMNAESVAATAKRALFIA